MWSSCIREMFWPQGQPSDVSSLAEGRIFLAEPPTGQKASALQARLLDEPDIVDAVPEGGRVRFVAKCSQTRKSQGAEKLAVA